MLRKMHAVSHDLAESGFNCAHSIFMQPFRPKLLKDVHSDAWGNTTWLVLSAFSAIPQPASPQT